MCRLLLMTGIQNPELATKFMKEAKIPMSWGNTHGLGYSATKADGNFFTERWHNNDMMFNRVNVMDEETSKKLKEFAPKLPKGSLNVDYDLRGEMDFSQISSVTMHTRFATCGREFFNTHPFVDGDFSLVHNGVIGNATQLNLNRISTCDSEAALQAYINNNVGTNIENAQAWLDLLSGYWAFGIFARDANGNRILDVIRNDAGLYYSEVDGLGKILATTQTIIETSCKELGLGYTKPTEINSNVLFRFNATTGELISETKLKDSKLNNRYSGYVNMYGDNYEAVTGKKKEEVPSTKKKAPREYKGKVTYTDGSYKIMFKDGGYTLYSSMGKVIEEGVEYTPEEKKTLCLVEGGKQSDSESQSDEDKDIPEFKSYEDLFNYLYNTDEPLLDRLCEYDYQFMTNYSEQFESLPREAREDSWQFDMFDDMLEDLNTVYNLFFDSETREN